jgi:hypothetical protein
VKVAVGASVTRLPVGGGVFQEPVCSGVESTVATSVGSGIPGSSGGMTPTHPKPPAKIIATSVSPNLSVVVIVVGSLKVARLSTDVAKNVSDQVEAPEVVNKTVSCGTRLIPISHEEALPSGVEQAG